MTPNPRSENDPIRASRIRKFLITHAILAGVALSLSLLEGTSASVEALPVPPWLGPLLGAVTTAAGYVAWRQWGARAWIVTAMLGVDSGVLMFATFVQGEVETPWSGLALVILVMMPLFTGGQRAVWILTVVQIVLFGTLLQLRANGVIPATFSTTDFAHDQSYVMGSIITFSVACICGAILAGRTSVDVLNSQRQLQAEIDQALFALKEAQARIVQQEKMLGLAQLTAGMAHEIYNPLAFTLTNLNSLQRDMGDILALQAAYDEVLEAVKTVDPEAHKRIRKQRKALHMDDPAAILGELLHDAQAGVVRVQNIIHDLKTFARMDEAPFKTIDAQSLHAGIASTLRMLDHALQGRATVVMEAGETGDVDVAPALLNQVVMNLVQNAAEAVTPPDGKIRVTTRRLDAELVIEVADNGPGIPVELRKRVFDPFFTTKPVGEGTGLGLSISYQIVDRHGGRIEIATAPEGGAVLRIVLPARPALGAAT